MGLLGETIVEFEAGRERIRARRYGVLEIVSGQLVAVHLRPWPKLLALPEIVPLGPRYHASGAADHCLLYYNQPWQMPNYLALKYMVSTLGTSYATFRAALTVLDAIAALKQSDAILCDAANVRITDRLLARFGWEPHKPQRWHRNFIRRFYGNYPAVRLPLPACTASPDSDDSVSPQQLLSHFRRVATLRPLFTACSVDFDRSAPLSSCDGATLIVPQLDSRQD